MNTTGPEEVVEEVPICTIFYDLSVWPVTATYTGNCSMLDTTRTTLIVNGDTLSG